MLLLLFLVTRSFSLPGFSFFPFWARVAVFSMASTPWWSCGALLSQNMADFPDGWFSRGCPAPSTAHGARSAAATELRRNYADQLRRAHSARRVSTRRAEWGASIIPPRVDSNFNGRGPQS